MKDYNASDVNEFLLSLNDENFALPKKTRDIFYVLPSMLSWLSVLSKYIPPSSSMPRLLWIFIVVKWTYAHKVST